MPMLQMNEHVLPFFDELSESELIEISNYFELLIFDPGAVVINDRSTEYSLYIICEGMVSSVDIDDWQQSETPTMLGGGDVLSEGEIFGELAFLGGRSSPASIIAMTTLKVLKISRSSFQDLRLLYPMISIKLFKGLAKIVGRRDNNIPCY